MNTMTTILQLTDLHVFDTAGVLLKGIPTRESLQDVVDFIRSNDIRFDHLVITGDHTHDERRASYQAVRDILKDWMDRLWLIPGNHDDRDLLRTVFADRIGDEHADRIQFHFTTSDWLCLGLDTHVPGQVYGEIDADQLDWVRQKLREHPDRKVVLFLHHPPVILGSSWMDPIGLRNLEMLQQLFLQSPQIQLACCGHVHHESLHQVGGCQVVTTPATGIQFSPLGETPNFVAGAPGFRLIELAADGVKTQVYRLPVVKYIPVA